MVLYVWSWLSYVTIVASSNTPDISNDRQISKGIPLMNMKPRPIVTMIKVISLTMAATSIPALAATSYADQIAGSSFGTSANSSQNQNRSNINVSTQAFAGGVPGQATTQEAVNAASLPSQSVINTTRPYQDINTQDLMFGEQLFRGHFLPLLVPPSMTATSSILVITCRYVCGVLISLLRL